MQGVIDINRFRQAKKLEVELTKLYVLDRYTYVPVHLNEEKSVLFVEYMLEELPKYYRDITTKLFGKEVNYNIIDCIDLSEVLGDLNMDTIIDMEDIEKYLRHVLYTKFNLTLKQPITDIGLSELYVMYEGGGEPCMTDIESVDLSPEILIETFNGYIEFKDDNGINDVVDLFKRIIKYIKTKEGFKEVFDGYDGVFVSRTLSPLVEQGILDALQLNLFK
ncbi:hypothetical protein [Paraclostridium bifermentans]|uniref:hypothetical protein n=1 Tax=Paraclostridium bifermentans TaxID=1490 RepID=UPI00374FA88F